MQNRKITVTFILAVVNILAFLANLAIGGGSFLGLFLSGSGYVKEYGEASYGLVMEQGQWWRLLTCGYLHMGIIHLLGNMAALEIVGGKVEEKIGPLKMVLLYNAGAMLTGFLWCLIFKKWTMAGASLGIFVLLGMVCAWLWLGRERKIIELNRAEKRYLIVYVIVGCLLGIGTIVVHLIGFGIGVVVGFVMLKMNLRGLVE